MRVLYRKPDIYEKFEAAIAKAKEDKKHIDSFQISEDEFKEFIDLGSDASDHVFGGYTVMHYTDGRPSEWFYRKIPVIITHE